jgi:hypothetical protein
MTTITIPARIVRYLREGLHTRLGVAAEDIGEANHEGGRLRPVLYAEPLERFDHARALLDLIGWKDKADEGPAVVDLVSHRPVLLAALQAQLETERNMTNEDPALKGAEKQIVCACKRVAEIEQFLAIAHAGLGGSA